MSDRTSLVLAFVSGLLAGAGLLLMLAQCVANVKPRPTAVVMTAMMEGK